MRCFQLEVPEMQKSELIACLWRWAGVGGLLRLIRDDGGAKTATDKNGTTTPTLGLFGFKVAVLMAKSLWREQIMAWCQVYDIGGCASS
jgi:hypothetical protein